MSTKLKIKITGYTLDMICKGEKCEHRQLSGKTCSTRKSDMNSQYIWTVRSSVYEGRGSGNNIRKGRERRKRTSSYDNDGCMERFNVGMMMTSEIRREHWIGNPNEERARLEGRRKRVLG